MTNHAWGKLKILTIALSTVVLLQPSHGFSTSTECGDALQNLNLSETDPFDSKSIDQKVQNLAELKLSLDLAKVGGASNIDVTAMKTNYELKEQELVTYLIKYRAMTREQLIEKIKLKIEELQKQGNRDQEEGRNRSTNEKNQLKKEQEKQIKESLIDGTRAIFHRIQWGSFVMGEVGMQKSVTLTKSFDMMATATTQLFYKTIADLANTQFPKKYKIVTDPSHFIGELNPVESVSLDTVQIWIRALNDLSQAGEPTLTDLIPGHKQGDVYRLPTDAEWEFVIRGRGTLNKTYHFGDQRNDLKDYGWYSENSGRTTHPVAQKLPLIIDGNEFYDMHGNVWEWVQDRHSNDLIGGVDPLSSKKGPGRVIRGGGYSNISSVTRSAYRLPFLPDERDNDLGFRLVRTVK